MDRNFYNPIFSLFDQEDIYDTIHAYRTTEAKDANNDMNMLVLGPWRHSGVNYEQRQLNALKLPGDTATEFRMKVLKPFLDQHLKTDGPKADIPPVFIFETGTMEWRRLSRYPLACASGCEGAMKSLYLQPGLGLSFSSPASVNAVAATELVCSLARWFRHTFRVRREARYQTPSGPIQ